MKRKDDFSRRSFLTGATAAVVGVACGSRVRGGTPMETVLNLSLDYGGGVSGSAATRRSSGLLAGSDRATDAANSVDVIKKKVCMLGAASVGKTSLVRRYVEGIYEDKYLTSLGVKIDKKTVEVQGTSMTILVWDIAAPDDFQSLRTGYLRNASGILLVVDGTRRGTLDTALDLYKRSEELVGSIPSVVFMFNKEDLSNQWQVHNSEIEKLAIQGIPIVRGSAKTAKGVEESFLTLATRMLNKQ